MDLDDRVVVQARPALEWPQLFNEAWRAVRDGYAEPSMGGVDWAAVREKYAALLPLALCSLPQAAAQSFHAKVGAMQLQRHCS